MEQNTVSSHQVGVLAGVLLLTLKLTNLPAQLYGLNGAGGIISLSVVIFLNIIFVCLLIWLKSKFKNQGLYEILKTYLGVVLTKLFYIIFFVFFMFKLLSIMSDGFSFIRDVADEEFTIYKFLICFLPVSVALANSGIRNISRTAEFFAPYIIIGLFVAIMFSFVPVNLWGVGSLVGSNFNGFLKSMTKLSFWNGDLFALIIFVDKIKIEKKELTKLFVPFILISILLINTYVVYYSLYQQTSIFHTNLLYDIVQYAIGTSSGWHMDIFAIIVYSICLFLQGGIFVYCANECLERIFNFKNKIITLISVVFLLAFGEFLFLDDYFTYVSYARNYLSWFAAVTIIIIPLMLLLIILRKRWERHANN